MNILPQCWSKLLILGISGEALTSVNVFTNWSAVEIHLYIMITHALSYQNISVATNVERFVSNENQINK